MIIDDHVHCPEKMRRDSIRSYSTLRGSKLNPVDTVEELISVMTKAEVDKFCLFAPHNDWLWGNQFLRSVAKEYPNRVVPVGVVNPRWGDVAVEEVNKFGEWGFKGLKLIPYSHSYPADCYSVQQVIPEAIRLGIPVHFHTSDHLVDKLYPHAETFTTYDRYESLADMFPDATIIMAHMCVSDWMDAIDVAKKYDNIILDTSGTTIVYGMLEIAVERVGADRIVYGSDAPLYDPVIALSKVRDSDLSERDKHLILGENIARLLGIETAKGDQKT